MIHLAVSNLAWPSDQDDAALQLVARLGIKGVEVAPTKLAAWDALSRSLLVEYRAKLAHEGLVASSLQAILFGRPDLQLLGEEQPFLDLVDHIRHVAEMAAMLGAPMLVFGAPRNRSPGDMSASEAWGRGRDRLHRLGIAGETAGVVIGIEPVPAAYGGTFLANWRDVLRMVKEVDSPAIAVHLDTACVALGGDSIAEAIVGCQDHLAHFHVAQPQLADFAAPASNHSEAAYTLKTVGFDRWVALEMCEQVPAPLAAVEQAVRYVLSTYR